MILVVATILITTVVLEQAIMTMVKVKTMTMCRWPKREPELEQMNSFALQPINLVWKGGNLQSLTTTNYISIKAFR